MFSVLENAMIIQLFLPWDKQHYKTAKNIYADSIYIYLVQKWFETDETKLSIHSSHKDNI